MEIWKDIPGYEGLYQVSSGGSVRSVDRVIPHKRHGVCNCKGKELSLVVSRKGYRTVNLMVNGTHYLEFVHRLVATAFIPNPENKSQVNHIDGDKGNNNVNNLEWCSGSENSQHAWDTGLQKATDERRALRGRSVICVETGKEYYSIGYAVEQTHISRSGIKGCCHGKRRTAGGYHWRFKEAE